MSTFTLPCPSAGVSAVSTGTTSAGGALKLNQTIAWGGVNSRLVKPNTFGFGATNPVPPPKEGRRKNIQFKKERGKSEVSSSPPCPRATIQSCAASPISVQKKTDSLEGKMKKKPSPRGGFSAYSYFGRSRTPDNLNG